MIVLSDFFIEFKNVIEMRVGGASTVVDNVNKGEREIECQVTYDGFSFLDFTSGKIPSTVFNTKLLAQLFVRTTVYLTYIRKAGLQKHTMYHPFLKVLV